MTNFLRNRMIKTRRILEFRYNRSKEIEIFSPKLKIYREEIDNLDFSIYTMYPKIYTPDTRLLTAEDILQRISYISKIVQNKSHQSTYIMYNCGTIIKRNNNISLKLKEIFSKKDKILVKLPENNKCYSTLKNLSYIYLMMKEYKKKQEININF